MNKKYFTRQEKKKQTINNIKKRQIDKDYRCPISFKDIYDCEFIGITNNGFVYNYDSIEKWFSSSNNCPMTNEKIHNNLIKIKNEDYSLDDLIKTINKQILSCKNSSLFYIPNIYIHKYNRYLETKEDHPNITNKDIMYRRLYYLNNHNNLFAARSFYQDLCHIDLSNREFYNKGFKCCNFSGCNLENTKFYNCDLSRCQFYESNLCNTQFINCRFWGEQVFFNFANTNQKTMFKGCSIEPINNWCNYNEPEKVKEILLNRGLTAMVNNEYRVI